MKIRAFLAQETLITPFQISQISNVNRWFQMILLSSQSQKTYCHIVSVFPTVLSYSFYHFNCYLRRAWESQKLFTAKKVS